MTHNEALHCAMDAVEFMYDDLELRPTRDEVMKVLEGCIDQSEDEYDPYN